MSQPPVLQIVIASTRPGRVGLPVGRWIEAVAREHGGFAIDVVDLAELALPMMDEPHHPRLRQYEHEHTRAWSARVDAADAFVLVFPEYNHSFTAPLKNALDYLHGEWAHKPAGLVSYGGVSAGTRAAQQLKPVLAALSVTPLVPAVAIPWVHRHLEDGAFVADDGLTGSARAMLDELLRTQAALRTLRDAG